MLIETIARTLILAACSTAAMAANVPIILDGSPKATIIAPGDPSSQHLAVRIADAIKSATGSTVPVLSPGQAMSGDNIRLKSVYTHGTLIVLGNINTNPAVLPFYAHFLAGADAEYPGGDGYELRAFLMPFGRDSAAVIVGASSPFGLKLGTDALIERLKTSASNHSLSLEPFIHVRLGPRMDATFAKQAALLTPAGDVNGLGAHAFDWVWTGRKEFADAVRSEWAKCASFRDHYQMEYGSRVFRVLRAYGFFSPEEQRKVDGVLWEHVKAATSGDYGYFPGPALTWNNDVAAELLTGLPSAKAVSLGNRHQTMFTAGVFVAVDDLLNRADVDATRQAALEQAYKESLGYIAALVSAGRDDQDDITGMMSDESLIRQAFGVPAPYYLTGGVAQWMAMRALVCTDNLGYYSGQGNYEECRAGGVMMRCPAGAAWRGATYTLRDPGWHWISDRFGFGFESWGMTVQPGAYAVGNTVPSKEPEQLLGVTALPARSYHYSRAQRSAKTPLPPIGNCFEKVCLRDGFGKNDQYLLLQGWPATASNTQDANCIIRYADRGTVWLVQNTDWIGHYFKNGVYVSDGVSNPPQPPACELKALADTPRVGLVASLHPNQGGMKWTRSIIWRKGRYYVVIDRLDPHTKSAGSVFACCTWRSVPFAEMEEGKAGEPASWVATSGADRLVLRTASDVVQKAGLAPDMEGAVRPYVLRQTMKIAKNGDTRSFHNVLFVSGPGRSLDYHIRKVDEHAVLLRGGMTKEEPQVVLAGAGQVTVGPLFVEAEAFYVSPDELVLPHGGKATWSGSQINSGPIPAELKSRLATLLGSRWTEIGRQSGPRAAGERAAFMNLPSRLWDGATKRGERLDVATVTTSKPADVGDFHGTTAELVDHAIPLWGSTSYTGDVTITLTLPREQTVDRVEIWGGHYEQDGVRPPKPKDAAYTVEFSNDGFRRDIRGGDFAFDRDSYPIQTYKGLFYAYEYHHADGLAQRARQVRIRAKGFGATEIVLRGKNPGDTTPVKSAPGHLRTRSDLDLVMATSNDEVLALSPIGEKLWSHRLGGKITSMLVADVDEDGLDEVLLGTLEQKLYCFRGNGQEQWVNEFRGKAGHANPWSIGLWRRTPGGPLDIFVGGFTTWLNFTREGDLEKFEAAGGAWYDAVLPRGLDLKHNGIEDQVFRATHWSGMGVIDGATRKVSWHGAEEGWGIGMVAWPDPKGSNVLTVTDTMVSLFDAGQGKRLWERFTGLNTSFACDYGSGRVWLGRRDGFVLELDSENKVKGLISLDTAVTAVRLWRVPNRTLLVVGTERGVRLYDPRGRLVGTLEGNCARLEVVGMEDRPVLAVMQANSSVLLYQFPTEQR